ncbi:polysaccharide lyase family protein [Peterkaempfera sp. SMS 1(5)a]|uniref:polysaccharide lyase family protein n=1 Tax=Peterkaempfera podocarpi TaxID=3232308 RepID=UPI00366EA75F
MHHPTQPTRRTALGLLGAAATTAAWAAGTGGASAATSAGAPGGSAAPHAPQGVTLTLNGRPAKVGSYAFPGDVDTVVLDNGLVRFTFGRDDAAGGSVTGWSDVSITATSVVVDGTELAHDLNGVEPRDPDRQHSFYIDAAGGKSRLVCSEIRVLRVGHGLAEIAFVDTTSNPLQHEHHLVMRSGRRGLYGYNILTATAATSINEVRMNTRWNRAVFDHCYNWERGKGQQPTYAYLATQTSVQDETWQVDGVNNPALPSPGSNSANLAPGTVYSKYEWSLYHHENPMFGHYGNGFGAWFTPLGGVTDRTLAGFYGVGPQHQDLAIHQDALILNYFGANHYGLPAYALPAGYRRLYGPWLTYLTVGDPADPDAMIADAARIAQQEIAENRAGSSWVSDPLYPAPEHRTTVTGRLRISDGRPAANLWVLLTTQDVDDVYTVHEPTYFVRTDEQGGFTLPGIPPAWVPGTTTPGSYTLYAFAADGSVTDQYKQTGITPSGAHHDLGEIVWTPTGRSTFLWQIGRSDRTSGEFALATGSPALPEPRAYAKPAAVPGDLTFTVGSDWEPRDWYYAQTNAGTWTVAFTLDRVPTGTAYLTVSTSMQQGSPPVVAVNGSTAGIVGTLPANNDSTIARQTDRSGFPRKGVLTFPASMLKAGANTVTFTRGSGTAAGNGIGWDTVVLEVDEAEAQAPADLVGEVTRLRDRRGVRTWQLKITNRGAGAANDVRLDGIGRPDGRGRPDAGLAVVGADPNRFPVPVAASIPAGGSVTTTVQIDGSRLTRSEADRIAIGFTANGGRARGSAVGRR